MVLGYNPLPCVVVYSEESEMFSCFGLCGQLLYEKGVKNMRGISIGRDSNFAEYVIYMERHIGLSSLKLPRLEKGDLQIKKEGKAFRLLDNQKMLLIATKDQFSFVWDPHSHVQKHSVAFSIL